MRVFALTSGDDTNYADTWNQIGQDIVGESNDDEFGWSVSLLDDGKILAVATYYANGTNGLDSGRVSVYHMDDAESNWIQIGDDIDGEMPYDKSGYSVSLSGDDDKVAISSPYNDDNGASSGHVRVYVLE